MLKFPNQKIPLRTKGSWDTSEPPGSHWSPDILGKLGFLSLIQSKKRKTRLGKDESTLGNFEISYHLLSGRLVLLGDRGSGLARGEFWNNIYGVIQRI